MARTLRFTYVCCGDVDCNCDRATAAAKESTATDSTTGEQLLRSLGKSELCFDNRSSLSGSPISPPQSDPDPFAEYDQVSPMLTRSLGTAPLKAAARARERGRERESAAESGNLLIGRRHKTAALWIPDKRQLTLTSLGSSYLDKLLACTALLIPYITNERCRRTNY